MEKLRNYNFIETCTCINHGLNLHQSIIGMQNIPVFIKQSMFSHKNTYHFYISLPGTS